MSTLVVGTCLLSRSFLRRLLIYGHTRVYDTCMVVAHTGLLNYGPLTRYVKLRVAHAPGMPGKFSPPPTSKETASKRFRHTPRHVREARTVLHVGIANLRWREKRSRDSQRMRNPQFYVSGKRPMVEKYKFVANYDIAGLGIHLRNETINLGIYMYCSFEDCGAVYYIYGYPIFQWISVT